MAEILNKEDHRSTQIAERISKVYQEDSGTYHFQRSNQPFNQISKGNISHIEPQSGKNHPENGRYVSPNIKQSGKYHQYSPKQGYHIDYIQCKPVIANKYDKRHQQENEKGYGYLRLGKDKCTAYMKFTPNVGCKRIAKLTKDCQCRIKKNQEADTTEKTVEKETAFFTIHRKTFRTKLYIHSTGSRYLIQKIDT